MSLYNTLARHVLAPSLDVLRGTHTMQHLAELEESQWWSRERIKQLQSERLRHLTEYTWSSVPYYHHLMEERGLGPGDIRAAEDLVKLPVLTKSLIQDNFDMLLAGGYARGQLLHGRTGGSTGTPLVFFSTREAQMSMGLARSLRALAWAGIQPGDRTVRISKERRSRPPLARTASRLHRMLSRTTFIDAASLSDTTLAQVTRTISQVRPRALLGYASAIHIVAAFIQETSRPVPRVAAVVTGGEQLLELHRETIREVFRVEPFSKYSSFENFDIAMECEAHEGMHVAAEDLIVEIVDDDGCPLPEGQEGRVLVTNLHDFGMPFIRYDTGDVGSFVTGECACGRRLPRLALSLGKTGDIIYTPSGKRLSPLALGASELAPLGVREFQFVQEELDRVIIHIVPGKFPESDAVERLRANVAAAFRPVLGEDVRIEVRVVESIEPTPAGKHLFLISRVSASNSATRR